MMLEMELLQMSLGVRNSLSHVPTDAEWMRVFRFAKEQAVVGVMFSGVERLPKECLPPKSLLLKWIGLVECIRKQNIVVDGAVEKLLDSGFPDCHKVLLKGQAVSRYYPRPELRQSGDIDIWCVRRGMTMKDSRRFMAREALALVPDAGIQPHHTDWLEVDGVHVELHFTPTTVYNLIDNVAVQTYFERNLQRCVGHRLPVDVDFVFQLMHIRRHLISEGVGLRQVIDLYMTLKALARDSEALRHIDKRLLKSLGVKSFAEAMMWVLSQIDSSVSAEIVGVRADERRGRFVLDEVLDCGNFGWYRSNKIATGKSRLSHLSYFVRLAWRCVRYFPSESLWNPVFRIYISFWRRQFK